MLKLIVGISSLLLFALPQAKEPKPSMVTPKITHHDEVSTQHYDRVEVSCPEGYEGHFVDFGIGFDGEANLGAMSWVDSSGPPAFMICFDKSFMEKVRANPDLLRPRPIIKPA